MHSIFSSFGIEIPLALLLMAFLGLRAKVWPRTSILINAKPADVFNIIDIHDGKTEDWGRTTTLTELIDPAGKIFKKTYSTTLTSGVTRSSSALFSVRHKQSDSQLEIQREGLEGRSLNNELLSQIYEVKPENNATRLKMTYEWGPRPLLAQLIARADLWGGAYRLKSLAETGKSSDTAYQLITAGVALFTAALSLIGFALLLNWLAAALLIVALFVHEFGHLLAYRMMGQPWGRMVFLPFLGAMAIPRLNFESQGQAVFAALMGPGFSILLAIACTLHTLTAENVNLYIVLLGLITTALNIFNLLPVEPLDGGVALRSILGRLMGDKARFGLMAIGVAIVAFGIVLSQIIFVVFGGLAILFNFKARAIDTGLRAMPPLQVVISCVNYVCLAAVYLTLGVYYYGYLSLLQKSV